VAIRPGKRPVPASGIERAHDEARQRGIADLVNHLIDSHAMAKFNVEPYRIQQLVSFIYGVQPHYWEPEEEHGELYPEPSIALEQSYQDAFSRREEVLLVIEHYSHYGIFTFIDKYYQNWISESRNAETVQRAMIDKLFPMTPSEAVFEEYQNYHWTRQPEPIWQFARKRYQWAKDQWPNLSDKITTIWTLQDLGLIPLHDKNGHLIGTTEAPVGEQEE
jgi:hypothetical protein